MLLGRAFAGESHQLGFAFGVKSTFVDPIRVFALQRTIQSMFDKDATHPLHRGGSDF